MADATNTNAGAHADDATGPVLAADGSPLKSSLNKALRAQKLRALALIAPLLIFVMVTFIAPIVDMLFRSVENQIVSETLPRTVAELGDWDATSETLPDDDVYAALYYDLFIAAEYKNHTRLGSRLNYEQTGMSSMFRRVGRNVGDFGELYLDQFEDLDERWDEEADWAALMAHPGYLEDAAEWRDNRDADRIDPRDTPAPRFRLAPGIADLLPQTAQAYSQYAEFMRTEEQETADEDQPWTLVDTMLYNDLMAASEADIAAYSGPMADALQAAHAAVPEFETATLKELFIESDDEWANLDNWATIKVYAPNYTSGYFLTAVDMKLGPDGMVSQPEDQQIYGLLFKRTLFMSMAITISCILLGYPVAWLLANLPMRSANLLMILVLLPFWTSLLVRTSAWKVMLQQQGVINDVLVWLGVVGDGDRLIMINNQFGTIVAMTHILLPFMILPLYSVMQTIPPTYLRAAKSLGATPFTAFWRVYFPQSVPGIGAGSILVFILAIGYYITPEIVGGTSGTFISNRIAYHISSSLNWGLAAALGTILLGAVLILYWAYDRIVGIDNVKLGG
ncbi:ABC transporter permease [Meridianimarinicoccus aquatilis]|uniref:ABC transporter permease n=1 Tax=Meridianimarinicoccus aquatilis TaxID=2552766 RepID=A0A4R6AZ43_9RHOB|nr:ABC transporter permease [Fluviibacterium aquatile]TDL89044.1 ABC transporter permease [Fluviibacterium aquatile]